MLMWGLFVYLILYQSCYFLSSLETLIIGHLKLVVFYSIVSLVTMTPFYIALELWLHREFDPKPGLTSILSWVFKTTITRASSFTGAGHEGVREPTLCVAKFHQFSSVCVLISDCHSRIQKVWTTSRVWIIIYQRLIWKQRLLINFPFPVDQPKTVKSCGGVKKIGIKFKMFPLWFEETEKWLGLVFRRFHFVQTVAAVDVVADLRVSGSNPTDRDHSQ